MGKIRFKIDEKSLYYGFLNDYERGEVMTSSTPINQSKNPEKWHKDIYKFMQCGIEYKKEIPLMLLKQLTRKTTSQAETRINQLFIFDNILLDGEPLETKYSFALYFKEEIDEFIKRRDGSIGRNTHLGRIKLHYPSKLFYVHDGFNISNKDVLIDILKQKGGFAYIVRGFDVFPETKTINFVTSSIALKGKRLSSVFKIQKGVGKKLLLDEINFEAEDLPGEVYTDEAIREMYSGNIKFDELHRVQAENGKTGEKYAFENLEQLINEHMEDIYHTSEQYPTAPYDIEYNDAEGKKHYVEVKSTSGSKEVFNMSSGEMKFMEQNKDRYILLMITNVKSSFPNVKVYKYNQIIKMKQEHPSTRFYA